IIPILNSNGKRATAGVSPLEIAGAAQNWESADRDESFLYRGALLRKAQAEYLPRIERLSSLEREFLTASIDAQSRQSRVAYVMLGVTFILLVFATAGSWYALYKNREYKTEKQKLLAQQETNDELLSVVAGGMDKVNSAELQTLLEHTGERPQPPTTEAPQPEPTPTATPEAQIFVTTNALVGPVRWELGGGGDVQYLDGWDARNIETVDIPQLRGVPGAGSGRVQFYRGAAAQLKAAWAEVEDAGLLGRVKVWNGSFARKAIGKSRLSVHALGLAFDINYDDNRTGRTPPLEGEEGSVRELVPIFKRHGFAWSGDNRIPDGSHFEVERIVTGPEVSGPGGAPYLKRDWKAPSSESIIRARYSMAVATFWR
ncbi:MAG TPA: M15 family metallopeptidase, partial [Pyrinomonadaceae bacterium]